MFGKNRRRIETLESNYLRVLESLGEAKAEICRLRGLVRSLQQTDVIARLDSDEFIALMKENNESQEEIDLMLAMKTDYEKKLKKFIRSTMAKRKPKVKIEADGKENPEAAE